MPNIFNANIRGGICGKVDELAVIFENNRIDIGCVTETWLRPSIQHCAHHIDKYICFRRDRQDGRQGGGVAVYVSQSLPCTHITTYNSFDVESLWLFVSLLTHARFAYSQIIVR